LNLETKIFWLLIGSFVVGLVFTLIPLFPAPSLRLFLFIDGREAGMTLEWYVYLACEKISRMFLLYALYVVTGFNVVNNFFIVECMDLGDFMLIMNKPWITIGGFDIEFNTWKVFIFTFIFLQHGRN
jgi:hypothetical protein